MLPVPDPPPRPLQPYLTAELPGCGGRIRERVEDFTVEELPLYEPCGSGEHLYLWVEKRGVGAGPLLAHLARALRCDQRALSVAGRKDTHAVTRQWVSAHVPQDPDLDTLAGEGIRVLAASRHGNKLRPGHLRGNRFRVVVRGTDPAAPVQAVLRYLTAAGFPNFFGEQRLGPGQRNVHQGRRLVASGGRMRGRTDNLRFATNAYQAALFNEVVALRLREVGDLHTLQSGDLAVLHRNGAHFAVPPEERAAAQQRADAHEISPSAPLFGYRTPLAEDRPGAWERAVLTAEGLTPDAFRLGSGRLSPKGERRAVRALPHAVELERPSAAAADALVLTFTLDAGVFATALLREVMKNDALAPLQPGPAPA